MMKKLFLILTLALGSCWKTLPDGRQYKVVCDCISGHNTVMSSTSVVPGPNGTVTVIPTTTTIWVCDYETCDTVWRKDTTHK